MRVFIFRTYDKFLKTIGGRRRVYIGTTNFGAEINCDIGDVIQKYIFYFGVWEPAISELTTKILRIGDVYIDVGANIGYDSLLAAHCVGGTGSVVSIEASPKIYELLNNNIRRNSFSNIRSVNVAASNCVGELTLYSGDDNNIGQTTTIESRGLKEECKIKALPLTEIALDGELSRTRLIKIDIEGGELPVLDNIIININQFPDDLNIIVEASAHEDEIGWTEMSTRFKAAGFKLYEIENRYDISWHLQYNTEYSLKLIEKIPNQQVDILLTRETINERDLIYWRHLF